MHFVSDLESATDFCYSCWAELNKTCEPETMSKDAREGSCKDMEPSSYCQRCGFVFGRPCAIIEQQRKSGRLHCARTSNRLCNSLNGKKPISADVQDAIVKLTPSHHKSKGSSCLPSDAKKVEVDWYGCIATTEVAVPSLVSKPDEKQSAYSLKLWEDWFEGKEPVRFSIRTDMHSNSYCQSVLLHRHWEMIRLAQFSKHQMSTLHRHYFNLACHHQRR
jgi:hypothetical protein